MSYLASFFEAGLAFAVRPLARVPSSVSCGRARKSGRTRLERPATCRQLRRVPLPPAPVQCPERHIRAHKAERISILIHRKAVPVCKAVHHTTECRDERPTYTLSQSQSPKLAKKASPSLAMVGFLGGWLSGCRGSNRRRTSAVSRPCTGALAGARERSLCRARARWRQARRQARWRGRR